MKYLAEIAQQANCSVSTVSRVLNNQPRISEATRKRVLEIARQKRYKGSRKSRTVAIILPEFNSFQLYSYLLQEACAEELQRKGFKRLIIYQNDMQLLTERYISGAIALTPWGTIARKWFRSNSQPLVCINDYSNLLNGIPSVVSADEQAIQTIFAELQKMKIDKVAIIYWAENTFCTQSRLEAAGKYAALCRCELHTVSGGYDKERKFILLQEVPSDCEAVIFSGEIINLQEILNREIFAGKKIFAWQYPGQASLTTENLVYLSQDLQTLAVEAVKMLQEKLSDPQAPARHIVVPCKFYGLSEADRSI